jgi:hypothetical protein
MLRFNPLLQGGTVFFFDGKNTPSTLQNPTEHDAKITQRTKSVAVIWRPVAKWGVEYA